MTKAQRMQIAKDYFREYLSSGPKLVETRYASDGTKQFCGIGRKTEGLKGIGSKILMEASKGEIVWQ